MALALNTSHPLYANLVSLIGIDDDNVVKDLKSTGRVCTKHASATIGTGTYGRHVRTTQVSGDSQGVALSPIIPFGTLTAQNSSVFIVVNDFISSSGHSRAGLLGNVSRDFCAPAVHVNTSGQVRQEIGGSNTSAFTTGNILTGAHSIAATRTHQTSAKLSIDGNAEVVDYARLGNTDNANGFDQIGGFPTGNWGAVSADFVWVATFDKVLSEAEIADLHASIGANNAFGLVTSGGGGGTDATAPGATITGSGTVSAGAATGGGTPTGSFSFDACENNTHSGPLNNVAVNWTWLGGTVGAITSITNGAGTMTTTGMTISGLPTGAGFGLYRTSDGLVIGAQEGTVA